MKWTDICTTPREYSRCLTGSGTLYYNSRVYLIGGKFGHPTSSVYSTKLDNIEWIPNLSLPIALYNPTIVRCNNVVFVIGGINCNQEVNKKVFSAKIKVDGSIRRWNTCTELPRSFNLTHYAAIAADGKIFITGGEDGNKLHKSMLTVDICSNEFLGEWHEENNLPFVVSNHSLVTDKSNSFYILGGVKNRLHIDHRNYHAGAVPGSRRGDKWTDTGSHLPRPLAGFDCLTDSNNAIIVGGITLSNDTLNGTYQLPNDIIYQAKAFQKGGLNVWHELGYIPRDISLLKGMHFFDGNKVFVTGINCNHEVVIRSAAITNL